jgi:hypothetical protein
MSRPAGHAPMPKIIGTTDATTAVHEESSGVAATYPDETQR